MGDDWTKRADYKQHMQEEYDEYKKEMNKIENKTNEARNIIFIVSIPVIILSFALISHDPVLEKMIRDARKPKEPIEELVDSQKWQLVYKTNVYDDELKTDIEVTVVSDEATEKQYILFSNGNNITVTERKE